MDKKLDSGLGAGMTALHGRFDKLTAGTSTSSGTQELKNTGTQGHKKSGIF
jgi:hypothetical protein